METSRIRPYVRSKSCSWEPAETDYITANDVFPVKIPLEKVEFGSWKYIGEKMDDIELLYELDSSDLVIKTNICGSNGAVPGTFKLRDVSAVDLSLVNVVPGSLESMVTRLVLETESKVSYTVETPSGSSELKEESEPSKKQHKTFDCRIITMSASVHESGHLRDVLLFLKCGYTEDRSPGNLFLSPQKQKVVESAHKVTFLEGLPFWVMYVPWWVYSKRVRTMIQRAIFVYSLFSVIWASWQLYRHVDVIHDVIEPIIKALRIYLASVMEAVDIVLALFTVWWTTFLSPLNILRGMLLGPLFQVAMQLKSTIAPLAGVLSMLLTPIWRFFTNSTLLSSLKALALVLYHLVITTGQHLWAMLQVFARPFNCIWQAILSSRIAVTSLDLKRIRFSWIFSLVMNSLKSIGNGLAKLVGYTRVKQKQFKALKTPASVVASKSPEQNYRSRRTPVFYSSPLTKQN